MNNIILSLILSFVVQIIFFIPAQIKKTDKYTDLSYGLSFVIVALILLFFNNVVLGKLILFLMIGTWAARLISYLTKRIKKIKKDSRFDDIRNDLFKFLQFWFFQAITVWIVLIPSSFYFGKNSIYFSALSIIGFVIWITGLIIEYNADKQQFEFKNKYPKKFITTGLWKYSRHPNYFGEMLCWIGVYLYCVVSLTKTEALISLVGPLYIIILLSFVSGIPILEKKHSKKYGKAYLSYKRKTSCLIPWFKK